MAAQGSQGGESSLGVARILTLASELAARVRYAQIVGHAIPAEQIAALVAAARLLQEYGAPWPHVVTEALQEVAAELESDEADDAGERPVDGGTIVSRFSRLLGAFRREKGPPDTA